MHYLFNSFLSVGKGGSRVRDTLNVQLLQGSRPQTPGKLTKSSSFSKCWRTTDQCAH
ncbi:hypothetical protein ACRRTK_009670 [Alexandromys fortis]